MIRVLHATNIWLTQTMTWIHTQMNNLDRNTFENAVCCLEQRHEDQFPTDICFLPNENVQRNARSFLLSSFFQHPMPHLYDTVMKFSPDILHSHFGDEAWHNIAISWSLQVPHVVSFYGYDATMLGRQLKWKLRYRLMFTQAAKVLCEGPAMGDTLMRLGCPRKKIVVQPLGIRAEEIGMVSLNTPFSEGVFRVLLVGSIKEKKGFIFALDAALRIANQGMRVEVTLVGDAMHHDLEGKEQRTFFEKKYKDEKNFSLKITGFVTWDKLMHIASMQHVYVVPSVVAGNGDTEGGAPVTLTEIGAMGLPIVATAHCDIPFVLCPEMRGYLVAERDVDQLYIAMMDVMENYQFYRDMAKKNAEFVRCRFNVKTTSKRLENIYMEVVKGRNER